MISNPLRLFLLVLSSFIVAWMLMLFPMPHAWQWIRPEWAMLVLIYWVFSFPTKIGVTTGWSVGLGIDILKGGLLGQYALSMVMVAYLAGILRKRLRLMPFWQQAFLVLILVGFGEWVSFLVRWLIGDPPRTLWYWAPVVSSVLLWPWISRLLKLCERKVLG